MCLYLKDSLARYKILGSHCLFFEYLLDTALLSLGTEYSCREICYQSHFTSGSFHLVAHQMASLSLKFSVSNIYLRVECLGQFSLNLSISGPLILRGIGFLLEESLLEFYV